MMAVVGAAFPPPPTPRAGPGEGSTGASEGTPDPGSPVQPLPEGGHRGDRNGAGGEGGGRGQSRRGLITSSSPEEDRSQDPDQQQQQQDPQKDASDADDQALHLAFRLGLGAGGLRGRLQDPLCRRTGVRAGTQRPAPPSPTPPHAVSKPAPGQGFRAQGHPQRPCRQPPFSRTVGLGVLTAVEGKGGGHHCPGCGAEVRHGAWRPRGHPAVAAPTPARGPAPRSGLQRPHLSL